MKEYLISCFKIRKEGEAIESSEMMDGLKRGKFDSSALMQTLSCPELDDPG